MNKEENKPLIPEKIKARLYPAVLNLFSENDFHQVNIRAISKMTGISSGTIYKYFTSKEDLLFTIIKEKMNEIGMLLDSHIQGLESPKEILRKVLWVVMDYYDKNPGVAVAAFITVPMRTWMHQDSFRMPGMKELFRNILDKYQNRGEVDTIIDIRRFQDIYYMICYRCIHTWYYFGMKWKLVDQISHDFDLYWKMFEPLNGKN